MTNHPVIFYSSVYCYLQEILFNCKNIIINLVISAQNGNFAALFYVCFEL